jgi:hypothetical protein
MSRCALGTLTQQAAFDEFNSTIPCLAQISRGRWSSDPRIESEQSFYFLQFLIEEVAFNRQMAEFFKYRVISYQY